MKLVCLYGLSVGQFHCHFLFILLGDLKIYSPPFCMCFHLVLELAFGMFLFTGPKCLTGYLERRGVGRNIKLNCLNSYFPICRYTVGHREHEYWKGDKPGRNKNGGHLDPGPDRGYGDCFNPGLCEHARSPCGPRHFACHPSPLPEAHPRPQICHDVCRAEEYPHDLEFDPELRLQWVYSPGHPSLKTHYWGPLYPPSHHGKGESFGVQCWFSFISYLCFLWSQNR